MPSRPFPSTLEVARRFRCGSGPRLAFTLVACLVLGLAAVPPALAQDGTDGADAFLSSIDWTVGPGTGVLGDLAQIKVPQGYIFAGPDDSRRLMESMQNPVSGAEMGFLAPEDLSWFVVFEFDDIGYVKDDEKEDLDADAILKSLKAGNKAANKERKKRGWETLELIGWTQPPHYDETSHNLEWGTNARTEAGFEVANYNTRILGRGGAMSAVLVVDPTALAATIVPFKDLLAGYDYTQGNRYAEYRQGDKLAKYGLTGLVTGGALVAAAKTGLLQKLWKLVVVGAVAVAGFFRRLLGGKKKEPLTASTR